MDRIKRLSMEVLGKHKPKFGQDFSDNKKALDEVTIIRSKGLKNEIAGYITKYIKREVHDSELRRAQSAREEQAAAEKVSEETAPVAAEAVTQTPEPETAESEDTAPAEAATETPEPAEAATETPEPAEAATETPEPAEAATETPAAEPEPEQTS